MTVIQLEQGSTLMIHSTLITSFLQIQPGWVLEFQHKNSGETQIFKPRQHIKKQRHYSAYKGPYSQSYGFPAVMYGCESWTIKKAEGRRTDAFKLRCWRRLLRVPWTARRSNQSILKEINPEYLLEGLMLKLKLQYFGHLMWRANSLEKTLMLGKIEGRRRRGRQKTGWLDGITNSWTWVWANSRRRWRTGSLAWCSPWGHKESDTTERLNNKHLVHNTHKEAIIPHNG